MYTNFFKTNGKEIDWWEKFGAYALNVNTKEFENLSSIEEYAILTEEDREKLEISEEKCGEHATYILYDMSHNKIGYVFVIC